MTAREVASILYEIETLLALHGEDDFKTRAYARAARSLETSTVDLEEAVRNGTVASIPGVGKNLGAEILEIVESGASSQLEELLTVTPPGLLDMLKIRGVGAKKVRAIHTQLGIDTLEDLEEACRRNQVAALPGFGAKSQEKILLGIEELRRNESKFRIDTAMVEADRLLPLIAGLPSVSRAEVAGRLRRGSEEYESLQFVVAAEDAGEVEHGLRMAGFLEAIQRDGNRITAQADVGVEVKLYISSPRDYVVALHQHTGAHDYAFMLSIPLHDRGYDLREDALYRDGQPVEVTSEEELFALAGIDFIPPEIREGIDEVPNALKQEIPELIEEEDMRGMLHVHSTWSDGQNSISEIAEYVRSLGYSYLLMCDHSKAAFYANGLDERRLEAQGEEIDEINQGYDPAEFRVLKGIECDILADGSMDFSDDVLASLDAVVASIHSNFNLPQEAQTERLCSALANPYVTILGHPTGRLILKRKGYDVDLRRVIDCAAEHGKAIELNANPNRLDLNWRMIRYARRKGVKIPINPDAHTLAGFGVMRYGVKIGRKGLLTKEDVPNTWGVEEFLKFAKGTRGEGG
jgi:DNA polymerase (family 10)